MPWQLIGVIPVLVAGTNSAELELEASRIFAFAICCGFGGFRSYFGSVCDLHGVLAQSREPG